MSAQPESPVVAEKTIAISGEAATRALAADLAATARTGDIILLTGDLGAGKTALARAFIRAFTSTPDEAVPSPTFTLLQTYDGPAGEVWHFDLYRLKDPDEIFELGWEDGLGRAVMLIEWPDRLGAYLPRQALTITLAAVSGEPEARTITLTDERPRS